jgi:hypothetical protein
MIKNYFPEYADAKIAAISPCVAKKREFEETGYVNFNVTIKNFKEIIEQRKINFNDFPPSDFDGPMPERAVSFSSPGGLKATLLRDAPWLASSIRCIGGTFNVYKYLNELPSMLENSTEPFWVDCLSCFMGCNGGPGTTNSGRSLVWLETKIEARLKTQIRRNKLIFGINRIKGEINNYWRSKIYDRTYRDLSDNLSSYRIPTKKDLEIIYYNMKKTSESDFLNCAACGYGDCYDMAKAIFNKLNRPENCHHYMKKKIDERLKEHELIFQYVHNGIFLLDSSGYILPSYSKALEEIFRRDMLAGFHIIDILAGFVDKGILERIDAFISSIFDVSIPDTEIKNNNPLWNVKAHFVNLDGSVEVHNLNFMIERIGDENIVEKILFIVKDNGVDTGIF